MADVGERSPRCSVAWGVHAFTGTGILCGLLGLISVLDHSPRAALLWLTLAMVIDGLDGPMARKWAVEQLVPKVDGHTLDLVIDYVTCVLAPAIFMHEFNLLPEGWVSLWATGLILLTSLYGFSRTDLMTDDNYFRGFPAMWNVVATCMFVLQSRPNVNLVITLVLAALTVSSVKFAHPLRVRDLRRLTIAVTVVWLAAMVYATIITPRVEVWAQYLVGIGCLYFIALTIRRSVIDHRVLDMTSSITVAPVETV